ncbi:DUF2268 domain-containing protein [Aquibacillus sediminis]|uniref:DUF2268 domain-containing protein n=1 Tax=Aquibacillus sediminis TaxID=2574734 RepID=UPI001107FFBF|nr:DUF2268 domain-containing protein [Aquibacillus sediminis]
MSVINTNKLLNEYVKHQKQSKEKHLDLQRKHICQPLTSYFDGVSAYDIQRHLLGHGLFFPESNDKYDIEQINSNKVWQKVNKTYHVLRKKWHGPDVPIFIFPANKTRQLREELNGVSGLAHADKVFLFVSDSTNSGDLQALITHEYNHVCRLCYLNQEERNIQLLDSIVLEGLAENAVNKYVGKEYRGKWTTFYSQDFALKAWRKWIKPHTELPKSHPYHKQLLYGQDAIPKWLGYNVGYYIVESYLSNTNKTIKEAIETPALTMIEQSNFSKT